jgi:hypothetical protein
LRQQSEVGFAHSMTALRTSGGAYRRAFALSVFIGVLMIAMGFGLFVDGATIPGAFLLGLGAVFMIYGFGHARAARTFKDLANEKDAESRQT